MIWIERVMEKRKTYKLIGLFEREIKRMLKNKNIVNVDAQEVCDNLIPELLAAVEVVME